jgi:hypothetical protein
MLRADMDALPVEEATGLPYASKIKATDRDGKTVPVMHAVKRLQFREQAGKMKQCRV